MNSQLLVLLVILFVLFAIINALCRESGKYTYPGSNPHRRRCVKCGQGQHQYCATMDTWNESWWELNGEIHDPNCNCHRDLR